MKRIISRFAITAVAAVTLAGTACNKKATDYRDFLNNEELTYPGAVTGVTVYPGDGRLMLAWSPGPDQTVTRYVVYWNSFMDSVVLSAASHNPADTVKTIISNLSEYTYSFYINSYNAAGDKSITTTVNNARVYGAQYKTALYNRLPDASNPYVLNSDNSVTLNFLAPDTININTVIRYTNAAGVASTLNLAPGSTTTKLPSYQFGTPVLYQSSYVPDRKAIDTFLTAAADTFPTIYRLVQCDKGLFRESKLSGDAGVYESQTSVSRLWDGSNGPQGYPNIYHSDGGQKLPVALSFDMGKVYDRLAVVEEVGRDCCHNPDDFEIWGIADTTGAITPLSTQDNGWKNDMQAKGWTLLTEAFRSDDGKAAARFEFIADPPPVRFIRIRIKHVYSGSDNSANMSELTFWSKEL